jgi:hypothetical protein
MCNFFSFVTDPENHGGKRFYFNWKQRISYVNKNDDSVDSHSYICKFYSLDEDKCNKYEYNPLTQKFGIDKILLSVVDDSVQAEEWVTQLDFKRIVPALIIKPVVHPFDLPEVTKVTKEHQALLQEWISIRASFKTSVRVSVRTSIGESILATVRDSVWDSIWASAVASIWATVGDSIWGYTLSLFDIPYKHDFTSCIRLWEQGLVPSFDGTIWRLHSGKKANIVYEVEGV